jgi:hypothetical protein
MTPIESLLVTLEKFGSAGLRLVATRTAGGEAFIVAYLPAETPAEANETPLGFLEVRANGGALAVPAAAPEGTEPKAAKKAFLEAEKTLGGLAAFEATALGRFGRGFDREGRLIR